ncbi:MAG: ABC transporter substrate-binding protein [Verrucomicrobiota bacterium]
MQNAPALLFLSLLAAFTALTAGCARETPTPPPFTASPSLRKVHLQTDWLPQAEHGGFYQALVRGYYAEVGLDVEILPGGPGTSIRPQVASGQVEFGMNRSDDTLTAIGQGLPLVIAGAYLQHDHLGLLLHADDPAKTLADLNGRTVTAMVGLTWIPFVQKKYGITFNLRPDTPGLTTFLADRTEIHQCLVTSEPYFATQQGVTTRTLAIADSGYDAYHVIITSRAFAHDHTADVRSFVAASLRGWDDYIRGDPTAAHAAILSGNKDMTPELLAFSRDELVKRGLVHGDTAKGDVFGKLRADRLAAQIAVLQEFGVTVKSAAPADVTTPEALAP